MYGMYTHVHAHIWHIDIEDLKLREKWPASVNCAVVNGGAKSRSCLSLLPVFSLLFLSSCVNQLKLSVVYAAVQDGDHAEIPVHSVRPV